MLVWVALGAAVGRPISKPRSCSCESLVGFGGDRSLLVVFGPSLGGRPFSVLVVSEVLGSLAVGGINVLVSESV